MIQRSNSTDVPEPGGLRWWQLFYEIPRREHDPLSTLVRWHRTYGPRVKIPIRSPSSWSFTDPDDVRHVLVTNNDNYRKVGWLTIGPRFLGKGLLTSDGALHRHQRSVLQPAFQRNEIPQWAESIVDRIDEKILTWKDGEVVNISREMARLTLANVGMAFFGTTFADVADDLLEAFLTCQYYMSRWTSFLPDSVPSRKAVRYRRATRRIDEIIDELLRSQGNRGRVIPMMESSRGPDGQPTSRKLIRDEIATMLWAGHETTFNALEWGWHLLSMNPEIEASLHEEVDAVLGGRRPSAGDVPNLRLTEMVFAETLRMYPPAWILARWAIEDDRLESGMFLPRRSIVFISPYAIHRDPRWYADPDRFDPNRFRPTERGSRPSLAYIPFGAGRRVCIGEQFGRLEGILTLARIAQRFRLVPIPGQKVLPKPLLTLRMKNDLRLLVRERSPRKVTTGCLVSTAS